jgi:hypothetical protein
MVLSAGIPDWEEDPKLDQDHALKLELQHNLAALSSHGVQTIVNESGHWIPFNAPGSIVNAVEDVVATIRTSTRSDGLEQEKGVKPLDSPPVVD